MHKLYFLILLLKILLNFVICSINLDDEKHVIEFLLNDKYNTLKSSKDQINITNESFSTKGKS